MRIGGLQKLTLLDYPGHVACTVFLQGCNFRCPFCHNTPLVLGTDAPEISQQELFNFLEKRRGLLDGVAVTGGEPLIWGDLGELLERIRALGFLIKLDTNGSYPQRLKQLLDAGLVDYVAMDVKNSPEKYGRTAGAQGILPAVEESVRLLLDGKAEYEFRTTVVDELHEPEDFLTLGKWITGAKRYFLQSFADSGDILSEGMHAPSKEKLQRCLEAARQAVPNTQIRGS